MNLETIMKKLETVQNLQHGQCKTEADNDFVTYSEAGHNFSSCEYVREANFS